ncbi:hypothetical protein B0H11DRAFT_1903639 [Mycena galericulata]|nr:hypothetical protein B0H11DRAFT_1903639 [Mycena galericulata]
MVSLGCLAILFAPFFFPLPLCRMAYTPEAGVQKLIKEISSANTRRREVLRDLNLIFDPMARLPVEISSDISVRCLHTGPAPPDPREVPMILLRICHSWRNLALSIPSLWTSIRVESPSRGFGNLLDIWLKSAGSLPLSISLSKCLNAESIRDLVVEQRAGQVRNLEVYLEYPEELEKLAEIAPLFVSLEKLTVGRADTDPTHSDSADESDRDDWSDLLSDECVQLFRAAPSLVECNLFDMYTRWGPWTYNADDIEPLTHSGLRHLRLGFQLESGGIAKYNSSAFLRHLTLPALQTLLISNLDIKPEDFTSFLERSSPPLRLTDLTLFFWGTVVLKDEFPFLQNLAYTHNFLPNLRNLMIRRYMDISNRSQIGLLVTALSARREQLQSFRLIQPSSIGSLDADIVSALRELVDGGMRIQIGLTDQNFV